MLGKPLEQSRDGGQESPPEAEPWEPLHPSVLPCPGPRCALSLQPRHLPTPPRRPLETTQPPLFSKREWEAKKKTIGNIHSHWWWDGGDGVGVVRPCPWCLGSKAGSAGGVTLGDREPGKTHALKSDRSGSNLAQPQSVG